MRIAVVGVGAIGGSLAADLADLGKHDLTLCVRSAFDRLVVEHPKGRSQVAAPVVTDSSKVGPVDWVLLATKAHQTEGSAPWLQALCGPTTRIAVLQNGVDHVSRVRPHVGAKLDVVPVVVQLAAEKTAAARIVHVSRLAVRAERGPPLAVDLCISRDRKPFQDVCQIAFNVREFIAFEHRFEHVEATA